MSEHQWGEPNNSAVRNCTRAGCTFGIRADDGRWRLAKGDIWRVAMTPIPPCTGTEATWRCTHVERIGIISKGECPRPALPRLVACEHHATPDALRLVILSMAAEIDRTSDLKALAQHFAGMACMGCTRRPAEFSNGMCTSCKARHALGLSSGG